MYLKRAGADAWSGVDGQEILEGVLYKTFFVFKVEGDVCVLFDVEVRDECVAEVLQ